MVSFPEIYVFEILIFQKEEYVYDQPVLAQVNTQNNNDDDDDDSSQESAMKV